MNMIIIPAFQPDIKLVNLVSELYKESYKIIVVDDGSGEKYKNIFNEINEKATIIYHKVNKGKGEAIKTALKYVNRNFLKIEYVAIMDADGQHTIKDVKRILMEAKKQDNALIIGSRNFTGKIPVKSKLGNKITRNIFYMVSGVKIKDTQTGLRAFSISLLPQFISVEGSRYEYEMNVLLMCAKEDIPVVEVPIDTIYHDKKNSNSHFRSVVDSIKIYKEIFKFGFSSFVSFLLDYVSFIFLIYYFPKDILTCNIIARILSGACNFLLNERFVFKSKENRKVKMVEYAFLAITILIFNNIILSLYNYILPTPVQINKILTEITLFIMSFVVQSKVIFNKNSRSKSI